MSMERKAMRAYYEAARKAGERARNRQHNSPLGRRTHIVVVRKKAA
jgi:hypothetical protein